MQLETLNLILLESWLSSVLNAVCIKVFDHISDDGRDI